MPAIRFKTDRERQAHPLGSQVNPYIIEKILHNVLNEVQLAALDGVSPKVDRDKIEY